MPDCRCGLCRWRPDMPKTTKRKAASKNGVKNKTVVKNKTNGKSKPAMNIEIPRETGAAVLDRLWNVVMNRRDADPTISHSARLLSRGPSKVAQKFGEEAVECLIEAVRGDHDAVIAESADVLYHLIVVWVSTGVAPDEVWAELARREGVSGIAEKASRARSGLVARALRTTKIP
jgi:phosphoribosyl-ATP pyrophosphohydrolase